MLQQLLNRSALTVVISYVVISYVVIFLGALAIRSLLECESLVTEGRRLT